MSEDAKCKCGFDHWPLPCKSEQPANERTETVPVREWLDEVKKVAIDGKIGELMVEVGRLRADLTSAQAVLSKINDTICIHHNDEERSAFTGGCPVCRENEARTARRQVNELIGQRNQLLDRSKELLEQLSETNCPVAYYTRGGSTYAVYGTSSIDYVNELHNEMATLRDEISKLRK